MKATGTMSKLATTAAVLGLLLTAAAPMPADASVDDKGSKVDHSLAADRRNELKTDLLVLPVAPLGGAILGGCLVAAEDAKRPWRRLFTVPVGAMYGAGMSTVYVGSAISNDLMASFHHDDSPSSPPGSRRKHPKTLKVRLAGIQSKDFPSSVDLGTGAVHIAIDSTEDPQTPVRLIWQSVARPE